ncbi:MAG: RnfABCDGE type electron transport complex subunit B [Betaproteobacteria bacterium AqS2]|uniref:RnfABCDGE type electron transport complex subunit B n=1 Tax=Candidatus Amphirhobacter heronislandensis TaxID=1732024 RepID=A0A930UB98_9GAMM|nr:RnfABCDGE type electron transport complex subunit B [Betaproteobacteria bacterium AqS2]
MPQLQCGECGFGGCRPYAAALAAGRSTPDRCAPGGPPTAQALGKLLDVPVVAAPPPSPLKVAAIDESRCVGCFKCIEACPVDAVIGAHGMMHAVDGDWCTGCGLCVEPCPVDCITLEPAPRADVPGQLVKNGLQSSAARAAAQGLGRRYERKRQRPPLRQAADAPDFDPAELAAKAMRRARRRLEGESGENA